MRAIEAVRNGGANEAFDIAFSFAGEDREIARRLAEYTRASGLRVFFDEFHTWEMWGANLVDYLGRVYGELARYCVILVSDDYCTKPYTIHERRFALSRALERREDSVLPVVLDDAWPDGLPRTTSFLDLRRMSVEDVAAAILAKVGGTKRPAVADGPQLVPIADEVPRTPSRGTGPIDVALVAVAAECRAWSESDSTDGWAFRGGGGYYEDPIFDVTIVNRTREARLVTAVGVEILAASFRSYMDLGGGGAEPLDLHRTYQLSLPDVWAAVAAAGRREGWTSGFNTPWVEMRELARCRLPDPVLVQSERAYRFGLHLYDYTSLCPTDVDLVFWVRTDIGESRSRRTRLRYLIGSAIAPLERFDRLLGGEEAVRRQAARALGWGGGSGSVHDRTAELAHRLWSNADRPTGRDLEFWTRAEAELGQRLLVEEELWSAYQRRLPTT